MTDTNTFNITITNTGDGGDGGDSPIDIPPYTIAIVAVIALVLIGALFLMRKAKK